VSASLVDAARRFRMAATSALGAAWRLALSAGTAGARNSRRASCGPSRQFPFPVEQGVRLIGGPSQVPDAYEQMHGDAKENQRPATICSQGMRIRRFLPCPASENSLRVGPPPGLPTTVRPTPAQAYSLDVPTRVRSFAGWVGGGGGVGGGPHRQRDLTDGHSASGSASALWLPAIASAAKGKCPGKGGASASGVCHSGAGAGVQF